MKLPVYLLSKICSSDKLIIYFFGFLPTAGESDVAESLALNSATNISNTHLSGSVILTEWSEFKETYAELIVSFFIQLFRMIDLAHLNQ
jgi:hypothetical protein